MNKFTRLVALLLVAAAVVLVVIAFAIGRKPATRTAPATASRTSTPAARPAPTYPVVVAATDLRVGEPIAAEALKVEQRPRAVDHTYARVTDLAGKVPVQPIAAGTPLTGELLVNGLSLRLEPGERALAVSVDEAVGVGNRIEPGDYVDVFFSLADQGGFGAGKEKDTQARLLLPRLRVLAYGAGDLPEPTDAAPAPPVAPAPGSEPGKADAATSEAAKKAASEANQRAERRAQARTAVLAVPVEEVNRLLLAAQNGKLALALRNPTDTELPDPTLFPQPEPVLEAKAGPTATATAAGTDGANPLDSPDNRAYAGIALSGLAGDTARKPPQRRATPSGAPRSHGIEVIRGTQRGTLNVPAASRPESSR
jgi:pilus assembly protein CpaB